MATIALLTHIGYNAAHTAYLQRNFRQGPKSYFPNGWPFRTIFCRYTARTQPMPILADNRQARFDYNILEEYEAGIVLSGQETKSVRNGQINLKGSYVVFSNGNPALLNAHISKYSYAGQLLGYDPTQTRRLLLKKREIQYLREKLEEKGLTIVPLSVYTSGHLIKVKIGLAKGKQLHDKRATSKKRDLDREVKQSLD